MNRPTIPCDLALIIGVALAATAEAHTLVVALGGAAGYCHVAVDPIAAGAAIVVVGALACALRRLLVAADGRSVEPDWAMPAFRRIEAMGFARVTALLVGVQLLVLFAGESYEQHVAGVAIAGISGLFGSSLLFAPLIHVAVGVAAALALWLVARAICRHTRRLIAFVRLAFAWLASARRIAGRARFRFEPCTFASQAQPLALCLANRPPPVSISRAR